MANKLGQKDKSSVYAGGNVWPVKGGDYNTLAAKIDEVIDEVAALEGVDLSADQFAAITGAAAPDASNVFATMADIPADELSGDELDAIQGAATPSASNVFATMADVGTPDTKKYYRAMWSCSGAAAMTETEVYENTIGTITLDRTGVGTHTITSSAKFTSGKTFISPTSYIVSPGASQWVSGMILYWVSTNVIELDVANITTGAAADAQFSIVVEIIVYP